MGLYDPGEEVNASSLEKNHTDVYKAGSKYFGSARVAFELVGFNYDKETMKTARPRSWEQGEGVIKEIQRLAEEGESLLVSNIQKKYPTLYRACQRHFKNYSGAVSAAGFYYSQIVNSKSLRFYGRRLEQLLSDVLKELGFKPSEQDRELAEGCIPDFVFRNEAGNITIYDSKLSEWTHFHSENEERYSDHCQGIVFVYLRESKSSRNPMRGLSMFRYIFMMIKSKTKRKERSFLREPLRYWSK